MAHLVSDPLPISFSITKDTTAKVIPQVVDLKKTEYNTPADFGYSTFSFSLVKTFDFQVGVFAYDASTDNLELTEALITVKSGTETLYSGDLSAVTNQVFVKDGYANYDMTVTRTDYQDYINTFTADELKGHKTNPLVVNLLLEKIKERVLYSSDESGDYDIYSMNPDGTDKVKILDSKFNDYNPIIVENGTKIAFRRYYSNTHVDLWIMNSDGSNPTELLNVQSVTATNYTLYGYTFNKNSRKFWLSINKNGNGLPLYSMNLDGSGLTRVRDANGTNTGYIFFDSHPTTNEILIMSSPRNWSPDRQTLIYNPDTDVFTTVLGDDNKADGTVRFIEKGTKILYTTSDNAAGYNAPFNFYQINIDGTDNKKITTVTGSTTYQYFDTTSSGKIVSPKYNGTSWSIVSMDADGTNEVYLTNSASFNELYVDVGFIGK